MKYNYKLILWHKGIFSLIMIIAGIIIELTTKTKGEFFGFNSVGSYLIYIGIIFLLIIIAYALFKKEKKIDERMMMHGYKSGKITYAILILAAFAIMIIDGINPINIPIHMMMAYLIIGSTFVLMISFWLMSKYN